MFRSEGWRLQEMCLRVDELPGSAEDIRKHWQRQASGVRVLTAGMIGAYRPEPGGGPVLSAVREHRPRSQRVATPFQLHEDSIPGQPSEGDEHADPRQGVQLAIEVHLAVADLRRQR